MSEDEKNKAAAVDTGEGVENKSTLGKSGVQNGASDLPGLAPLGDKPEPGTAAAEDGGKTPASKKPVSKLRSKLAGILGGGKNTVCTCGRKPGVQGRHASNCPVSGGAGARRFETFSVEADAGDDAGPAENVPAVAGGEQPATSKNHSFYRKLAKKFLTNRSRLKVLNTERKNEPLVGAVEAAKLAADYGLSKEEIEELGADLEASADAGDWPEFSPLLAVTVSYLEIELRWKINDYINERRIKKLIQAQREARRLADNESA